MKTLTLVFLAIVSIPAFAQSDKKIQIATAVSAAPENQRDDAMVYGYDKDGKLIVIRSGSNKLICVADNPNLNGFHAVCYHKDLEPFMNRSRELRKEGKNNGEIFNIKEEEVKSGMLIMPNTPTTLHVLSGPDGKYNSETGKIDNANYRYVVYIPFATQESTGLPLKPVTNGGPWLMNPGTHRAHIMISTPEK